VKKTNITWTEYAHSELEEIYQYYIDNIGIVSAQKLINNIFDKTSIQLSRFPESGGIEPYLTGRKYKYRYLVVSNYKVIYTYNNSFVFVIRVFDCRLNPDKLSENIL